MAISDFFSWFQVNLKLRGKRPQVDSLAVPQVVQSTMKVYVGTSNSHLQGVVGYVNDILAKGQSYIGVEILPLSGRFSQELLARATKGTRSFIVAFVYREKLKRPIEVTGYLQVYLPEADGLEKLVEKINQFADTHPVIDVAIGTLENLEHGKSPTYWARVLYYI